MAYVRPFRKEIHRAGIPAIGELPAGGTKAALEIAGSICNLFQTGMDLTGEPIMAGRIVRVSTDKRGAATVTLNRPDRNNAYNGEMIDALATSRDGSIGGA